MRGGPTLNSVLGPACGVPSNDGIRADGYPIWGDTRAGCHPTCCGGRVDDEGMESGVAAKA